MDRPVLKPGDRVRRVKDSIPEWQKGEIKVIRKVDKAGNGFQTTDDPEVTYAWWVLNDGKHNIFAELVKSDKPLKIKDLLDV